VVKVALRGEVHGDSGSFSCLDNFFIADATTRLNHGPNASIQQHLKSVCEREKRIRRSN
jgi:hypothetical protein